MDLVDCPAFRCRPCPPLAAIDRSQLAFGIFPLVPDRHAVFFQIPRIGFPPQKPQQLMNDRAQMEFLGRHARESLAQIIPRLSAENRNRASACPVGSPLAVGQHIAHQIMVSFHARIKPRSALGRQEIRELSFISAVLRSSPCIPLQYRWRGSLRSRDVAEGVGEFFAALPDEADDERGPTGLVGGAEAFAGFRMEVFVK